MHDIVFDENVRQHQCRSITVDNLVIYAAD